MNGMLVGSQLVVGHSKQCTVLTINKTYLHFYSLVIADE